MFVNFKSSLNLLQTSNDLFLIVVKIKLSLGFCFFSAMEKKVEKSPSRTKEHLRKLKSVINL
jgi:hypothetical protein